MRADNPYSLLEHAVRAGAREEIDGQLEVFAHGTTSQIAKEIVKTQGDVLVGNGGNFGGEFYVVPTLDIARVFARRSTTRLAGSQPAVLGVALPKTVADQLRNERLLKRQPISSPPPEVPSETQEWVFVPGAIERLRSEGFFFLIE